MIEIKTENVLFYNEIDPRRHPITCNHENHENRKKKKKKQPKKANENENLHIATLNHNYVNGTMQCELLFTMVSNQK